MKNSQLFSLFDALQKVAKIDGARFAYWVSKNIKIVLDELKVIEEQKEQTEKYKEFEKLRIALCEKHSKKDSEGNAIIIKIDESKSEYDIKDQKKFIAELDKLKEEHTEAIAEYQKKLDDYQKLLKDEITIEFFSIKVETIPEGISANLIFPLMDANIIE